MTEVHFEIDMSQFALNRQELYSFNTVRRNELVISVSERVCLVVDVVSPSRYSLQSGDS